MLPSTDHSKCLTMGPSASQATTWYFLPDKRKTMRNYGYDYLLIPDRVMLRLKCYLQYSTHYLNTLIMYFVWASEINLKEQEEQVCINAIRSHSLNAWFQYEQGDNFGCSVMKSNNWLYDRLDHALTVIVTSWYLLNNSLLY